MGYCMPIDILTRHAMSSPPHTYPHPGRRILGVMSESRSCSASSAADSKFGQQYIRYYMQLMRQPPTIDSVQRGASLYVEGGGATHAHTHDCTRTHTCTHARTHACTHTHTHAHTCTRTNAQAHAHTHMHTHAQTHTDQLNPTPQTSALGGGGGMVEQHKVGGGHAQHHCPPHPPAPPLPLK